MNKIVIRRPGGFERMKLEAFPDPEPGTGEVLVRTRGIGVNYADCIARMGLYKSANQFVGWPLTPGFEFSGEVLAVGASVTDFAPGNRVLGVSRFGAYSDRIVVHSSQLVPLPAGLSFEQAGGFQVAFLTAWYGLVVLGAAREGSTVLVHSAAGGVGSALCQLGRSIGARVLGVVGSSDKVSYALAQGAAHVIDKSATPDFSALAREFSPRGFDLVLDANGASTLRKSFELLAPMGRLVAYGFASMISRRGMPNPFRLLVQYLRTPRFNPLEMVDRNVAVFAFNLSYLFDESAMYRSTMTELLKLLSAGKIEALPVVTHPLAEAGAAHRALQSGRTTGKLVLVPSS
jgi:NADPH:quinone reductase-like Zn-dependent oxidoreductase